MLASLRSLWRAGLGAKVALSLLVLALVAHAGSIFGQGWSNAPSLMLLHAAVVLVGLAYLARAIFQLLRHPASERGRDVDRLPRSLVLLAAVFALYALAWLIGALMSYGEGGAEPRGTQYVWVREGRVVRELSMDEYEDFDAAMLSVFSAGWAAFLFAFALGNYKLTLRARRRRGEGRNAAV